MQALEQYIKKSISLTVQEIELICSYFKPASMPKGAYFSKTGMYCTKLSFVQSGHMRVFVTTKDKEITQWISPPGYFITDLMSFMYHTPARWNIQALTDCELLEIDKATYDKLSREVPIWKDLDKLFIINCFGFMEERIFNHLHMSTEERFHQLMNTQPELFNLVPLQYLASMLGMTPETLSRLRKKLVP